MAQAKPYQPLVLRILHGSIAIPIVMAIFNTALAIDPYYSKIFAAGCRPNK